MGVSDLSGHSGMGLGLSLAIMVVGLVLSAFFSGSETGYMSVSRVRLNRPDFAGKGQVRRLLSQLRQLEDPIMTCLIGTNLSNVLITAVMTALLLDIFGARGEWMAMAVVSTLVILLGEILPKVLYREYPEKMTLASVRWINLAMLLFTPARFLLRQYSEFLKKVVPMEDDDGERLDRSNLSALMLTSTVPAQGDKYFKTVLDRYLTLGRLTLGPIMQPIDLLKPIDPGITVGACLKEAARSGFSRLPMAREGEDGMLGYILVRDLLFLPRENHADVVPHELWRSFLLVDVRMSPYELFEELGSQSQQLAVVVEPSGAAIGLITLEDLIEAVIGSVSDEFDTITPAPEGGAKP